MRRIIFVLFALVPFFQIQAQTVAFFEGELLIQTIGGEDAIDKVLAESPFLQLEKRIAPGLDIYLVSFDIAEMSQQEALRTVGLSKHVTVVQNNHKIEYRDTTPNDPGFDNQWQYINNGGFGGVVDADLDAELAWDITTGGLTPSGDEIVICVIDDGLNPNQPDFGDNVWVNEQEVPNNGVDDDGNGFIDDYEGWDAYNGTDNIYETGYTHGTSVAGIVGAKGNNGIGVAGVNWDVKLMIVEGGGGEADALAAYAYPLAMRKLYNATSGAKGAFVVATNASWGVNFGQPAQAPLWCNMYDSLGLAGVINAGATINDNVNVDVDGDLPTGCSSDYLITVTNIRRDDNKETFAGYGATTIDLGAFGAETYTTADASNGYDGFGGTSGATPHVAGAVGLIYAAPCQSFNTLYETDPAAAALAAKEYILEGGDDNASIANTTVSGKRLNLHGTLVKLDEACINCPIITLSIVSDLTTSSATIVFSAPGASPNSYTIRYRILGTTQWLTFVSATPTFELTGLSANSIYEYQIQSNCTEGDGSFSEIRTFDNSAVAIRDLATNTANIQVYPNPSKDLITILYADAKGPSKISITDVTGKEVYNGVMQQSKKRLNIAALANGFYLLHLVNESGEIGTRKIQKF